MRTLLAYKSPPDGNADSYTTLLPIGLGYLAAALRAKGHSARLANLSTLSWRRVELLLEQERPDLVAISQFTHNRFEATKLAELVKKINPASFVVLGGPHATHCYSEVLSRCQAVD
ncbi:MAG TPA: cobalamin-dependent protein, partial [Geobacteraceae bacterium]